MNAAVRIPKTEPKWITREAKDLPKPSTDGVVWYLLHCNVLCEAKAAWGLLDRGVRAYLPLSRRWVRPSNVRGFKEIRRPAFLRYLFVGLDPLRPNWLAVRKTKGIESVICNNLAPVRISRMLIEDLMMLEDHGAFDQGTDPSAPRPRETVTIRVGDKVTLMSGPFEGYTGHVARAPKQVTGDALIELAGRSCSGRDVAEPLEPCEVIREPAPGQPLGLPLRGLVPEIRHRGVDQP
eukprot:gene25174-27219_t